jgi:hypothetical protein
MSALRRPRSAGGSKSLARLTKFVQIPNMLPDEQTTPEQFEAFRRMSPARRLELPEALYWEARELKKVGLRAQHRDWTEEQISREVTRIFLTARS